MEKVKYEVREINRALDMLNNLTVSGINNAHAIVEITKILQSPIDDRNNEPAIKPNDLPPIDDGNTEPTITPVNL